MSSGDNITIQIDDNGNAKISKIESEFTFAFELRNAARQLVNSAKEVEGTPNSHWPLKSFIYGAIILAYASLEAALNEIIHLRALDSSSPLDAEEKKVIETISTENLQKRYKSNTLQQYNLILRIIGKPELQTGEAPFQAANFVRILRNMLVHPVPGNVITHTDEDNFDYSSQQEIVKKLRSHLNLSKEATFPEDVLTVECASWAVKSCEKFLHKFKIVSGITPGFIIDD